MSEQIQTLVENFIEAVQSEQNSINEKQAHSEFVSTKLPQAKVNIALYNQFLSELKCSSSHSKGVVGASNVISYVLNNLLNSYKAKGIEVILNEDLQGLEAHFKSLDKRLSN